MISLNFSSSAKRVLKLDSLVMGKVSFCLCVCDCVLLSILITIFCRVPINDHQFTIVNFLAICSKTSLNVENR